MKHLRLFVKIRYRLDRISVKKRKPRIAEKKGKLILIYRISDAGYKKVKPDYINNENCLRNAVAQFPLTECHWIVLADNVCDETHNMILKYIPEQQIEKVAVGHGAGTFRLAYDLALTFDDNDCIYFLENDYLHRDGSLKILLEAFDLNESEYITLYDHPDKYGYKTDNPFIFGGEKTTVYKSPSAHWKETNSTTMTFAARVKSLRKDKDIFWKWTSTIHPYDFKIFYELTAIRKRRLISPIPSYSTHGETKYLSALVDWDSIGNRI